MTDDTRCREDDNGESSVTPISLSGNSFDVDKGVINVLDAELNIGSVQGSSFKIDAELQAKQDDFYKKMQEKFRNKYKKP